MYMIEVYYGINMSPSIETISLSILSIKSDMIHSD